MLNPGNLQQYAKKAALVPLAVMSLASPFVAHEEGVRLNAYLDAVGKPTICYGETEGVKMGDKATMPECTKLLFIRVGFFAYMVDYFIEPPMKPQFHAALTSWSYNIGVNATRKSTVVKRANAGNFRGACDGLLAWRFAKGKDILLGRRMRERDLCLQGV